MDNKPRKAGKRSKSESLLTQQEILNQAEVLFASKGYGGVSIRDIAIASGVQHHTITHHYGSKAQLYQQLLNRWDHEVEERMLAALANVSSMEEAVDVSIEELFEFLLSKRNWLALTARAAMGEQQPEGVTLCENQWISFIKSSLEKLKLTNANMDIGLMLISIEGILNAHILSKQHYLHLYGKDVIEPNLKAQTKQHLKTLIYSMINTFTSVKT